MKKYIFAFIALLSIGTASTQVIFKGKKSKSKEHFSVKNEVVYYDDKPIAKYQAKTYSLDNGELVEEYNLLLIDNKIQNKQLIGDLIDFVSDRHKDAEVEVEINADGSEFKL